MTKQERYQKVLHYFETNVGLAETELNYGNPFELLVAVILSAQCTDKRVNLTTPKLFKDYPDAESMAAATPDTIFSYIRSISYPNNKAKHLVSMAKMLLNDFDEKIPSEVEQLVKLPGVGRKTANVVASVIYNKPTMAVDTHVFRVSNRIGLTNANNPLKCEKELVKFIPEQLIPRAHHWLILHGRYVCVARKPKCGECGIAELCNYFEKNFLKQKIKVTTVKQLKSKSYGKEKSKKISQKSGKKSSKKIS
ncbi:MAG: endonuclease III [Bacteroidetes bacterium]|nr:endonuclease III [Bacteroidota bacterium]